LSSHDPARHTIHREHIHHGWNNAFAPRLRIAPGEVVHFETVDASSGQLNRGSTAADLVKLDLARVNPVTGPVFVDGAMPGDALKVTVLTFKPSGWGWTGNIPGFGLLADQFPNAHLHHWNYDPGLKPAMYGPGGRVPLKPMCGTIGVALAEAGLHSIIPPRHVGGNMDVRDIAEGTELYLPIEVAGALFSVGDTHAAQGDGEVCGTAIETAMDIAVRLSIRRDLVIDAPHFDVPAGAATGAGVAGRGRGSAGLCGAAPGSRSLSSRSARAKKSSFEILPASTSASSDRCALYSRFSMPALL
jgi:acetamidase/formamidase